MQGCYLLEQQVGGLEFMQSPDSLIHGGTEYRTNYGSQRFGFGYEMVE